MTAVSFVHPAILWLAPVAAVLGMYLHSRSAGGRRAVAVTRALCLVAGVVALARPVVSWVRHEVVRVAVVDISNAVGDAGVSRAAREIAATGNAKVVAFSNAAVVVDSVEDLAGGNRLGTLRERLGASVGEADPVGGAGIEDALQLAGSAVPAGGTGELVLYTAGMQTRGDALAEVARLARRGIAVKVIPLEVKATDPFVVQAVRIAGQGALGETLPVEVKVAARPATRLSVVVEARGERLAGAESVEVGTQPTQVVVDVPVREAGLNVMRVRVTGGGGTEIVADAACLVEPARDVLLIDRTGGTAAALQKLLGIAARVRAVAPADLAGTGTRTAIDAAHLVVLGDVTPDDVPSAVRDAIRQRVGSGGGLLLAAGEKALGAGGWAESLLADLLPVTANQQLVQSDPSATAVFIIDTSGSMASSRLDLAKEVVRLALGRLQAQDKAGIVEFYGAKRWAAPIQPATNRLELHRALNRLTAGGGTEIYPAVEEASYALRNVTTRTRHVVIISDGGVESAPFESLVRKMSDAGQTLSCVVIGNDPSPLMESMAEWGGGRFYRATDRLAIPELILHRPDSEVPPAVVREPTGLVAGIADDVTRDVDLTSVPAVQGYVRVTPKPTADVLVSSSRGDPIVTRWRHGLGRVAVLPTGLGSAWTADAGRSAAAGRLVSNLFRSLYGAGDELAVRPVVRPAGLEVRVERRSLKGDASDVSPLELDLATDGRVVRRITAEPIRGGTWNVLVTGLAPASYEVNARAGRDVSGRAAVTVPRPALLQGFEPDPEFFRRVAEIVASERRQVSQSTRPTNRAEISGPLILVSMMALLLNVYLRRRVLAPGRMTWARSVAFVAATLALGAAGDPQAAAATMPATTTTTAATRGGADEVAESARRIEAVIRGGSATAGDWASLASLRDIQGDQRGAIDALRQASRLEQTPERAAYLHLRLAVALAESNPGEAWPSGQPVDVGMARCAFVYGRPEVAARLAVPPGDLPAHLLAGSSFLDAGDAAAARESFAAALPLAVQPYDRRFILERLAAAARQQGALDTLVEGWLSGPSPSPEQLVISAGLLRDMGRVDDLLAVWRRVPRDVFKQDPPAGARFSVEVIGAAKEAGKLTEAAAVTRAAWDSNPTDVQRLAALVGVLAEAGRGDEADAEVRGAAGQAGSAAEVMRIARAAADAGREDAAISAATLCEQSGSSDEKVAATLFSADVERRRGRLDSAQDYLRRAAARASGDARLQASVADAYERASDRATAIAIYSQITPPGEEVRRRLAWLLQEDGQVSRAQAMWVRLAQDAPSPARRREAQSRLLDLASRAGTIGDLAVDTQRRLSGGAGNTTDVGLLVEIYVGMRDSLSAAEVLESASALVGGPAEVLRRQADVFLRCNQFGLADRALRRLLAADPASAIDTLQRVAVLAIERNRPDEAKAALEEVTRRVDPTTPTAELKAGIYAQLGQHDAAAEEYRRAIADRPERAEYWILWANAMKQAGRQAEAVRRLLLLAADARDDEMFSVAVDGLLNLQAPRDALRVARRLAIAWLCADGRKLLRYELVRDLSDAVGDAAMSVRVGELSLLVAGDQRTALLRELIHASNSARQTDRSVAYQRTLLALGDHVPPQVFLDVGRQLLADGRAEDAARAFRRAQEVSDDEGVRLQVGSLYERAGELIQARRALEPLLHQRPNDVDLRARLGAICEQMGDMAVAVGHYQSAIELIVRQGDFSAGLKPPASFDEGLSKSVSDAERYMDSVIRGLLSSARSDQEQSRVADWVGGLARRAATTRPTAATASVDRAVTDLARLARRILYPLHRADLAETVDREIAAAWPDDQVFAATAAEDRLAWSGSGTNTPVTVTTAEAGAEAMPKLIMAGEPERARSMLGSIQGMSVGTRPDTFPLLVASALAVGDREAASRWAQAWFARAIIEAKSPAGVAEVARSIRSTWAALDEIGRRSILLQLRDAFGRTSGQVRAQVGSLVVQVSLALGEDPDARTAYALAAAGQVWSGEQLAGLVEGVPESDRATVLDAACRPLTPERRRGLLLQFATVTGMPLGSAGEATLARLFPAKDAPPSGQDDGFGFHAPGRTTATPGTWRVIAQAITGKPDASITDRLLGARAFALAGDESSADRLARGLIDEMIAADGPTNVAVLSKAVASMSLTACREMFAGLGRGRVADVACAALVNERLGQWEETIRHYRRALELRPDQAAIRGELLSRLREDLRWTEMLEAFAPFAGDVGVVDSTVRSNLSTARRQVEFKEGGDWTVFSFFSTRPTDRNRPQSENELSRFRAYQMLLRQRRQYSAVPAQIPARAGGLADYDHQVAGRPTVYQALAPQPWAVEEFMAALRSTLPRSPEVEAVVAGLAAAPSERQAEVRGALLEAARRRATTVNDRALLLALVGQGHELPKELTGELSRAVDDTPPTDLQRLATLSASVDRLAEVRRAAGLKAWVASASKVLRYADADGRTGPRDLTSLPPPEEIPPGVSPDDATESARLLSLADRGDGAAANRAVWDGRQRGLVRAISHPRSTMVAARIAAERGDMDAYRRELSVAIDSWLARSYQRVPDLTLALPNADTLAKNGRRLAVIREVVLDRSSRVPSDRRDLVRAACLLGRRLVQCGMTREADIFLNLAKEITPDAGEHVLWVADLARLTGRHAEADREETRLLRMRMLPAVRLAPLVRSAEKAEPALAAEILRLSATPAAADAQPTSRPASKP